VEEYLAQYEIVVWLVMGIGVIGFVVKKLNPQKRFVKARSDGER
jgi:hypothetical protein